MVDSSPDHHRSLRRFLGRGGVALVAEEWGLGGGAPVLLLHGAGQTRSAWDNIAAVLSERGYRAIAIDLRGHGESEWAQDGDYGIDAFADDVIAVARALPSAPVIVGASLGGLAAMVAEARAAVARALVLVDIAPRIEDAGVARIVAFMSSHADGFATLEEAADAIASYLPNRARPGDVSGLRKVLRAGEDGRWRWHWDPGFLDASKRWSERMDRSLFETAARQLRVPTLLVRGRDSDVVSPVGAAEFLRLAPHARFVDIASAGHMVAGDRNDVFTDAVVEFIGQLDCYTAAADMASASVLECFRRDFELLCTRAFAPRAPLVNADERATTRSSSALETHRPAATRPQSQERIPDDTVAVELPPQVAGECSERKAAFEQPEATSDARTRPRTERHVRALEKHRSVRRMKRSGGKRDGSGK